MLHTDSAFRLPCTTDDQRHYKASYMRNYRARKGGYTTGTINGYHYMIRVRRNVLTHKDHQITRVLLGCGVIPS